MKALLKYEFQYLWDVVRSRRYLKSLPRGWSWQYLIVILIVYLLIEILVSFSLGFSIYKLFPTYFGSYNEPEPKNLFLLMVIAAPVLEELLFRLPMVYHQGRLKAWFLLITLMLFGVHWIAGVAAFILLVFLLAQDLDDLKAFNAKKWFKRNSKIVFWLLTIAFALIHITNYDLEELPIYAYPIVVITQLIGGIMLGLVRIRFGLRYSIINHALFNGVIYLIIILE